MCAGIAAVEIIIGWQNQETKICTRRNGFVQQRCVKKDTFNIVSAEEWREFWVGATLTACLGRRNIQNEVLRFSYSAH